MTKRPLIHLGYYKTGTTFLQRHVIGNRGLGFIPMPEPCEKKRELTVRDAARYFISHNSGQLLSPWEKLGTDGRDFLVASARHDELVPALSHERFLGYPMAAGPDALSVFIRLHDVFRNARYLIVLREQRSLILSTYVQYLRRGGTASIDAVLSRRYDNRVAFFSERYFFFHFPLSYIVEAIGAESLLVLPFELLVHQPRDFIQRILAFSEAEPSEDPKFVRENESNSVFIECLFRYLNPLLQRSSLNAFSPVGVNVGAKRLDKIKSTVSRYVPSSLERHVGENLKARIQQRFPDGYFSETNRTTSEIIKLDLARYGYDV
ncbi:MAG: hypothetical protein JJT81_10890 [Rubellimicrobium sp.]|nr:hypothetical protein [Rubellimicrobium sp.]